MEVLEDWVLAMDRQHTLHKLVPGTNAHFVFASVRGRWRVGVEARTAWAVHSYRNTKAVAGLEQRGGVYRLCKHRLTMQGARGCGG